MRRPVLALAAVAALLLSGCASGPSDSPGTTLVGNVEGQSAPLAHVLRADLDAPIDETRWANGTVAVQDTCNTGACIFDVERAFHRTTLEGLPMGVPVELSLEMQTQASPLWGTFDLFLDAPGSVIYWSIQDVDHAAGVSRLQALVRPNGPVQAVVAAYSPGGGTTETPYSLSIHLLADAERVFPGAPVGVKLGPGDNLSLQAPGQDTPAFLLYGPDDALVGRFEGTASLPPQAPAGEYAVLLPLGSQWGNLSTDGAVTAMRALGVSQLPGPEGTMAPNGAYDAEWEITGEPLGAGLNAYTAPDPSGSTPGVLVSNGLQLSLTGPRGAVLDTGLVCNLCLSAGFWIYLSTGTGHPDVVAGTYRVHGESQATYGLRVQPFALYLDRA